MVRVIKVALFILSVIAVCYVDCSVLLQPEAVAGGAAHAADYSSTFSSKTYTIDMVKHSNFSDAELGSGFCDGYHAVDTRLQRVNLVEYHGSLRGILQCMSLHKSSEFMHKWPALLHAPYRTVSGLTNYYVYTLRRIII